MLTDGKRGSADPGFNWLYVQNRDLDAVIDLGDTKMVRHMESSYYQLAAWHRLLPVKVEYMVSVDGINWEIAGSVDEGLPIDQYDAFQRDYIADFEARPARFVRVRAQNIGNLPAGHPSAGQASNVVIDEFVVE
jgi:hexosaminidase